MAARLPRVLAFSIVLAALAGCGKGGSDAPQAAPAMPPPEVGVVTVSPGEVGLLTELPGRLEPSRVAEVRARAAGIVLQRVFREGSDVRAGQLLYRIDAAPYAAATAQAQAALARAQATLQQATNLAERYRPLVAANAISQQEYVNAVAAQKQAEAEVAAARAQVRTSEINQGYASVTAPISGRIGRSLVTEGALVGQGEATPLTTIQQINPLYVNFTQSATQVLNLRRAMQEGRLKRAGVDGAEVRVLLEDGSVYPQAGRLLFADQTVDPTTGQVTLRAEVPNASGLLLPGMYVRVRIEEAVASNALLLPQQAVTLSPQGDSVMVVTSAGLVEQRPVTVGSSQDGKWVILGGLKAGEQVIVDGFQKLQPGKPVKPVPWTAPGTRAPAGPAGTAAVPAARPASGAASAPAQRASN